MKVEKNMGNLKQFRTMVILCAVFAFSGCGSAATTDDPIATSPTPAPLMVTGLSVEQAAVQASVLSALGTFTSAWRGARASASSLAALNLSNSEWTGIYQNLFNLGLFPTAPSGVTPLSGITAYATLTGTSFDFSTVTLTLTVGTKQLTYVVELQPDTTYQVTQVIELDGSTVTVLF